ncbi:hypothetical protein [Caldimonas brevitalea]|uniref:ABC-type multidrug transport system, ATPase and permease component n=1 Tax=Caldimonas brevitalea TaxID=413882 RepID=A0A0G3BU98_9BURK|nr:hypothetical protein [Caldimonas brevitalea]AKJ30105.1 ABC-type multidrug transport system, ATPase and permease component [Caldimonas brevitalea]
MPVLRTIFSAILFIALAPHQTAHAQPQSEDDTNRCNDAMVKRVGEHFHLGHFIHPSVETGGRLVASICKSWPTNSSRTIAAFAYDGGVEYQKELLLAIVDARGDRVIASHRGAIAEGGASEVTSYSLKLDTARYTLSKTTRAFALRLHTFRDRCQYEGGFDGELTLYIVEGRTIRPILTETMSHWRYGDGNRCGGEDIPHVEANVVISVEPTSTNGFADLRLATRRNDKKKGVAARVKYNGDRYDLVLWQTAFGAVATQVSELGVSERFESKICQDVESEVDAEGVNSLMVVQAVAGALGYKYDPGKGEYIISPDDFKRIADQVEVVSGPQHGAVVKVSGSYPYWRLVPDFGYVGKDKVSFSVDANGRRVLLTIDLLVSKVINERQDGQQDCDFVRFGATRPGTKRGHLNALSGSTLGADAVWHSCSLQRVRSDGYVQEIEASIAVDGERVVSVLVDSTLTAPERGMPGENCHYEGAELHDGIAFSHRKEALLPVKDGVAASAIGIYATPNSYRLNLSKVSFASCAPKGQSA